MTLRALIAGGGTGGHVFPALCIAGEIRAREPGSEILFVGTRRGLEATLVGRQGYEIDFVDATALKSVGLAARLRGLAAMPRALWQSLRILRRFRPDVVLGVGGYASGPIVFAARLIGLPTALAESNAIPGFTNRWLGRVVRVVCVAFDETAGHFAQRKVRLTGNPVRPGLAEAAAGPRAAADRPCVFVFGGSQGAQALSELACGALVRIVRGGQPLRIIHQTGEADVEKIRNRYAQAGVEADVRAFIDDMAACYRDADVVIARSGATTIAELTAVGRPAVLVPYPFAADDHQFANARALRDAGAALVFRQEALDESVMADVVHSLVADPDRRAQMAAAMRRLARPDAAARIVDELSRLAGAAA